jgi:hypothetical protein
MLDGTSMNMLSKYAKSGVLFKKGGGTRLGAVVLHHTLYNVLIGAVLV